MEPAPWNMASPERLSAFHLVTKLLRRSWKACLSMTMSSAMVRAGVGTKPPDGLAGGEEVEGRWRKVAVAVAGPRRSQGDAETRFVRTWSKRRAPAAFTARS